MSSDEEKEVNNLEKDIDEMYCLMQDLTSEDKEVSREASDRIEEFVKEKKRARDEKDLIMGCKTTSGKISINDNAEDKRKRLSEEFRQLGNESFRGNDFVRAKEYYTSAILQHEESPVLFNNRAQAWLKLQEYEEAVKDAEQAMKLNPNLAKSYVIMARGLRGQKFYYKALEVLEIAETDLKTMTDGERKVIRGIKKEIQEEVDQVEQNLRRVKENSVKLNY